MIFLTMSLLIFGAGGWLSSPAGSGRAVGGCDCLPRPRPPPRPLPPAVGGAAASGGFAPCSGSYWKDITFDKKLWILRLLFEIIFSKILQF